MQVLWSDLSGRCLVSLICVPDSPSSVVNKQLGSMSLDEEHGASSSHFARCFVFFTLPYTQLYKHVFISLAAFALSLSTPCITMVMNTSVTYNSLALGFTAHDHCGPLALIFIRTIGFSISGTLFALFVSCLFYSQEEQKLWLQLLLNLRLCQPAGQQHPAAAAAAAALLPPPAPADPVQQSRSSASTTAQREPPPAP